jgi:hypothetical protein
VSLSQEAGFEEALSRSSSRGIRETILDGKRLKCLTIIDEWTRECLGAPAFMRSDNGPELVSNAILKWIVAEGTSG